MAEKENKDGVKCREHSTIKIATFNFEDLLKYRTCAQIYVFFLSWWDLRPLFFVPVLAFRFFRGATFREMSAHREERRSRTNHGEIVLQKHDYRRATSCHKRLPVVRRRPLPPLYIPFPFPRSPNCMPNQKKTTSELEKTTSEPRKTISEVDLPPPYGRFFGPFSRFFSPSEGNGYSRARMRTLLYILFVSNVAGLLQGV